MAQDWSQFEAKSDNDWSRYEKKASKNPQDAFDVLRSIGLEKEAAELENQPPINRKGVAGVVTDIAKGVYNAVPAGVEFAYNLPKNLYQTGKLALTNPELAKRNVKAGSASAVGGLLNAPGNVVDYLREKELAPPWLEAWRPESVGLLGKDFDYRAAEGLGEPTQGEEFLYGAAQFLPNILLGKASPAAWAIEQNQNPITAQLMPKIAHETAKPVIKGAKKGIEVAKNLDLTPSGLITDYVKNNVSLSELADNMRAAEGTNTPIGDVFKSPALKKQLENKIAPRVPFEATETYKKINDQIQERADKLVFDQIGKDLPDADTNPLVKDLLRKAYEDNRTIKNNLYNEVSDLAASEKLQLDFSSFNELVNKNKKAIQSSPLLKNDADFRRLFNKLSGLKTQEIVETEIPGSSILNEHGRPIVEESIQSETIMPTVRDANIIANSLYEDGKLMLKSPNATDRHQGALYIKLGNALRADVNKSIAAKGSDALKNAAEKAKEYYKDEFVQFLDKDLYKLLDEDKNPQSIVNSIIKPSNRIDNYALIEKVQKALPKGQENLLGYTYLRNAIDKEGILQPAKVKQLVKVLGKRQFESLFPNKNIRQSILDYSRLHNLNSEAAGYLLNLKNGSRNQEFLKDMISYLPDAVFAGAGHAAGGIVGSMFGLVASKMAKTASNKHMLKLLTSEEFRNKVASKMQKKLESKEKKS